MKTTLVAFALLLVAVAHGQTAKVKPCIAFSSPDAGLEATLAKHYLLTAVLLAGDFDFYDTQHPGCWTVSVLILDPDKSGIHRGYVASFAITNVDGILQTHDLKVGPDDMIDSTMREAAALTIRGIREQGNSLAGAVQKEAEKRKVR